jgi:hypothetical protein
VKRRRQEKLRAKNLGVVLPSLAGIEIVQNLKLLPVIYSKSKYGDTGRYMGFGFSVFDHGCTPLRPKLRLGLLKDK